MIEWGDMSDDELEAHKKAAEALSMQSRIKKEEHFEQVWLGVSQEIEAVIQQRKNIRNLYS